MATTTLLAGRTRMESDEIGVNEAARILRISVRTVQRLIETGQLKAHRKVPSNPKSWRVLERADVEAFRAAQVEQHNPDGDDPE